MKILLINGSPKGKRSNSLKLAYSFIEGFTLTFDNNIEKKYFFVKYEHSRFVLLLPFHTKYVLSHL